MPFSHLPGSSGKAAEGPRKTTPYLTKYERRSGRDLARAGRGRRRPGEVAAPATSLRVLLCVFFLIEPVLDELVQKCKSKLLRHHLQMALLLCLLLLCLLLLLLLLLVCCWLGAVSVAGVLLRLLFLMLGCFWCAAGLLV